MKAVFELRAACLAGYAPDLFGCHSCGDLSADRFDITEGRLECSKCRTGSATGIRMPVGTGVLEAMRYICSCDKQKLFSFTLPQESAAQLSQVSESYLSTQLERGFSALDFYKSLLYQSQ